MKVSLESSAAAGSEHPISSATASFCPKRMRSLRGSFRCGPSGSRCGQVIASRRVDQEEHHRNSEGRAHADMEDEKGTNQRPQEHRTGREQAAADVLTRAAT